MRNIDATLTSITWRHSSSGISVNGRIASDAYRPALLTRMSIEPHRSTTSSTSACDRGLVGDVDREADAVRERRGGRLRSSEVGDDDARSLRREPVRDRVADALRAAGDDRDLAVELPHRY